MTQSQALRDAWPGVALAALIAIAAAGLSGYYGAPAMLFALLIGMAFHHLSAEPRSAPGLDVASKFLLRLGVALLGLRLSFDDIASLGWAPVLAVVGLVAGTMAAGLVLARVTGRASAFGTLAGGAVAICGASAAMALAAVLPRQRVSERDVLFVVAAVTALSTLAMVLYPVLFGALGHTPEQAGFLIGATIHDVAQVVGAGYSMSETTGDTATFVKLQRVALLPLAVLAAALIFREGKAGLAPPWFLTVFVLLVLLNNLVPLPELILDAARTASGWLLLTAIAALGVRTSLKDMAQVGPQAATVVVGCTLLLLGAALALERLIF
ncbi:YeiH family protein [Pseudaestuariivita sp.]|uniref:YeiH family protein n=1 Tax=Pseudaestuariivita sp. TaxID=2211669 RepID=UPI004059194E